MAVALIVPTRRSISRPLLDWPSTTAGSGASGSLSPPAGLVLKRSGNRGYTPAPDGYQIALDFRGSPRRVKRVQQVQRRCPWARAMIASPYIRQLRYGLSLFFMHGRSRGKGGGPLSQ